MSGFFFLHLIIKQNKQPFHSPWRKVIVHALDEEKQTGNDGRMNGVWQVYGFEKHLKRSNDTELRFHCVTVNHNLELCWHCQLTSKNKCSVMKYT